MSKSALKVNPEIHLPHPVVKFDNSACYDVTSKDFKLESLLSFIAGENTLSSLAIASITGKRHSDVLRDTRVILNSLGIVERKFASHYVSSNNRTQPCYNLPKLVALNVLGSYSTVIRKVVLERWEALEKGTVKPALAIQQPFTQIQLLAQIAEQMVNQEQIIISQQMKLESVESKVDSVSTVLNDMPTIEEATREGEVHKALGYRTYGSLVSKERFYQFAEALDVKSRAEKCITTDGRIVDAKFYQIDDLIQVAQIIKQGAYHEKSSNGKPRSRWSHSLINGEFELRA